MEKVKRWSPWVLIFLAIIYAGNKLNGVKLMGGLIGSGQSEIDADGPAQVTTTTNHVTVKPKTGPPTKTWKPAEAKVTITTQPDGKVQVKIRRIGLCFGGKIGALYIDKLSFGIGVRFAYWNRLGLSAQANQHGWSPQLDFRVGNLGVGMGPGFDWVGKVGVSASLMGYIF